MIAALAALAAHAGTLSAADHHGRPEAGGIGWTSTFAVATLDELRLAVPLDVAEVVAVEDAIPVREGDRIVALRPQRPVVSLRTRQPDPARLRPPLALDPAALQQVSLDDLRFVPAAEVGVVTHVGWRGPPGVSTGERRDALQSVGEQAWARRHGATLLKIDRPWPDGLPGEVGPAGRVSLAVTAGAVVAALGVLLGLFGLYRTLEGFARRERIATFFAEAERDRAA